jgi:hypothetical protein
MKSFTLTEKETKDLVFFLEKIDKENDGIPSNIQDIAEKMFYFIDTPIKTGKA